METTELELEALWQALEDVTTYLPTDEDEPEGMYSLHRGSEEDVEVIEEEQDEDRRRFIDDDIVYSRIVLQVSRRFKKYVEQRQFTRVQEIWDELAAHVDHLPRQIPSALQERAESLIESLQELELRLIYSFTSPTLTGETDEDSEIVLPAPPVIELPKLVLVGINERLAKAISQNPELLRQLHPRDFEEYIAELFAEFGYTVELTARTKDGGKDIVAVRSDRGIMNRLIVECKRYAPHRKVDVSLVRQLYGVKEAVKANKAILATTSYFTRDARQEVERNYIYQLELKDFDAIADWARGYTNFVKRVIPEERITPASSGRKPRKRGPAA